MKADLVEWGSNGDIVGKVILNTTASGNLEVLVNMDTEPNLEDYDVIVVVRYYSPPYSPPPGSPPDVYERFPDILHTDTDGHGNAHVSVGINPPPTDSSIWVTIRVRELPPPPPPPTPPRYMTEPVEVSLK